jgi:VWFA-related protein
MRFGPVSAGALVALALATRPVAAGAPQQPPVFGAAVDLVRLDVLVLDDRGRPVTGLTKEDFEVEEGARPQAITSFEPVVVRGARPAPSTEPPRLSAGRLRAPSEGRCLFLYVDDIHVQQSSLDGIRRAILRFLENDVREGDWVTVVAPEQELWWTARNGWEYRQLAAVLGRIKGQGAGDTYGDWASVRALEYGLPGATGGRGVMAGGTAGAGGGQPAGIPGNASTPADEAVAGVGKADPMFLAEETVALVKRRTAMTLGGLRQAIESLVPLRGHKSLVMISEGFLLLPRMPGYQEIIDLARRANVAIHFVDPRGLETGIVSASSPTGEAPPGPEVMPGTALALPVSEIEGIALVTGGHAFGVIDAEKALRQVVAESEAYYLVGYSPDQPKSGERKVKVRVRREGVKVVARSRYFVPADPTKPSPAAPTPAHAAMRALSDTTDLPLRVATLFFEANRKGEVATMLATEVVPPPGKPGERLFKLVSEARARDGGAPVRDHFEGSPEVRPGVPVILARQWYLPPGVWQVRLLVEDTVTGRIGTVRHTFEVPDPKTFRLSTPILTAELEDPAGKKKPKVALGRTFRTGSTLYCQYNVYGAEAAGKHDWAPHALGGWALRRGDELVRETPPTLIQPGGDGRLTRTLGLSLQGAPPGEYSLTLVVRNEKTGETLQRKEPFTVGP